MAATDQNYRSQRILDIVFGVTSVLMLASIVWMFAQDYFREFKVEARDFRDVEEGMAERQMLKLLPDEKKQKEIEAAEEDLKQARAALAEQKRTPAQEKADVSDEAAKIKSEARAQAVKADYDSIVSLYNIAVETRDEADPKSSFYPSLERRVEERRGQVQTLAKRLADALADVDKNARKLAEAQDAEKKAEKRVSDAVDRLKGLTADLDRFAKTAAQKRWGAGDWFRALPVIDAFASPTRIQQFTLDELPIDYNFKRVTRFDRCTTCHQGIDRPSFDKQALRDLRTPESEEEKARVATERERLAEAKKILDQRRAALADARPSFNLGDVRLTSLNRSELSDERIKEYCAHPRLDLFVEAKSPHPSEKFGCTICHSGQGSATEFNLASHAPNDSLEKQNWKEQESWEPNHFWDFPMLPHRFVESSCIKCHHRVLDILPEGTAEETRDGIKHETPGAKVVRGYNLIRENGCFGCHEISGIKAGRAVGPDLRLEPSPPLEAMTPLEREKMLADPLNLPGTERKVGPSLKRISEKTNQEWVRKWIRAPRDFRHDTRMPHFYGLSNNNPDVLPDEQKVFPDAEIHSIAYYLFRESKDFLQGKDTAYSFLVERKAEIERKKANHEASEQELRELEEATRRLELSHPPKTLAEEIRTGDGNVVSLPPAATDDKARQEQIKNGRRLFTEKGCLACHSHSGTSQRLDSLPGVTSEANFGPNLSLLAAKIAPEASEPDAKRRWLVQWIINPNIHSPRTKMPITHLSASQAADVAAWLLSRPADWEAPKVSPPARETLEHMARLYLEKTMSPGDATEVLASQGFDDDRARAIHDQRPDADELRLAKSRKDEGWEDKLKWYAGKKAIGSLGCFGCHEIPGFELSKPIGTPLNDWGKKDPERIAYEDISAYVEEHYYPKDSYVDEKGFGYGPDEKGRQAYEQFYVDALSPEHRTREGFLNQKLREPRSYDYHRARTWDDRLRMPQFQFARDVKPLEGETPEQAQARAEAEAREAVTTFVLGLIAEPIPPRFIHQPTPDRLAIVKGKQALDKFNCAGCHQLKSGVYEFKNNAAVLDELVSKYGQVIGDPIYAADDFKKDDPLFANHDAWVGRTQPRADRIQMHALPLSEDEQSIKLKLTRALRFTTAEKQTDDIPAAEAVNLPTGDASSKENYLVSRASPEGGAFAELMIPYFVEQKLPGLDDRPKARSALPPPLLREGEKAQPAWLFQFLRSPFPVRPQRVKDDKGNDVGVMVLRMPRFNMSDEEAMALVNYFAAVDRLANPAAGLEYPYLTVRERDEGYLADKTKVYLPQLEKAKKLDERLQGLNGIWERLLKDRAADLEAQLKEAEKSAASATGAAKMDAEKARDSLKAELAKFQEAGKGKDNPLLASLRQHWEAKEAYSTDAYRLLANPDLCLKCHQVGSLEPAQPIGPPLALAPDRLRPDWTKRWLGSPQRLLIYPDGNNPMPQPFARGNDKEFRQLFEGTSLEKVTALRDVMMNYQRVAELPEDRLFRPSAGGSK